MNAGWPQFALVLRVLFAVLAFATTPSSRCHAQQPYAEQFSDGTVIVTVNFSATELEIAEPTTLTVQVEAPTDTQVSIPPMTDVLEGFEMGDTKNWDSIPIDNQPNQRRWKQTTEIESLRPGSLTIPTFDVSYALPAKNGTRQTISTKPIELKITSALPESVAITDFRDIKSTVDVPLPVPPTSSRISSIMIATIATACLALLGWRWQRRRNVVPIQTWATREIAIVRRRARDRVRTHAELQTDLIEVLRQYVTERFGIDAKTMSNRELATSLRETAGISGGLIASLTPIFDAANRARFAGKNDDDPQSTAIDRECDTLQVFVDNASSMLTSEERV